MLLLGIDLGTSFVKVSVTDANTGNCIAAVKNMDTEARIISQQQGWAEQCPNLWWQYVKDAICLAHATKRYNPKDIAAIGIAYQMHGLVLIDRQQQVLRDSIIWCDSRAVEIGNKAFHEIGKEKCLSHLLNSPGNFTASKLAWVKEYEPQIFDRIHKIMLPGDFIAMKLTGEITTTPSALSEGVFWDFSNGSLSKELMKYFGFEETLIPDIQPVFSIHGSLSPGSARELSLPVDIPVTYKAGDQLNNALSLNVMKPGEVAATAGTSGVIYAITDQMLVDKYSRVNSFAHLNHSKDLRSLGMLLCINGCGNMNSWIKKLVAPNCSYEWMNEAASKIPAGSEGLKILPFGNGTERMFENKTAGAQLLNLNLNKHHSGHICRAAQEGIAFAFRYGLDIMQENGMDPTVIRAGMTNLFLSDVFIEAFVNSTELEVEIYPNDGSAGAAIGAGIGAGIYKTPDEAFRHQKPIKKVGPSPDLCARYENNYHAWKRELKKQINYGNCISSKKVF